MKSIATIAVTLISVALATPIADEPFRIAARSTPEVADFDKLNTSVLPLLSTIPVPYKELNFSNFAIEAAGVDGLLAGVAPNTPDNYIVSGPARRLSGQPTVDIAGTKTLEFELDRFYYGCLVADQVAEAQLSTACTFSVTGYKKKGMTVGPKSFTFTPDSKTNATMLPATFDRTSWAGLIKVVLELTSSPVTILETVFAADTFQYKITQ